MRSSACDAWSMPSTERTPRIDASCVGTSTSTPRIGRVAEEAASIAFSAAAQRGAQLLDDAAHRLPVGDAAVQLLHPRLERFGRHVLAHRGQALGEAADAVGVLGVVEVAVFERGFDVEQAGRDFHGERRRRRGVAPAASARPPSAARRRRSRRTERACAANRRPARTARSGRRCGASRRRPSPTMLPWPTTTRFLACAMRAGSKRPSTLSE